MNDAAVQMMHTIALAVCMILGFVLFWIAFLMPSVTPAQWLIVTFLFPAAMVGVYALLSQCRTKDPDHWCESTVCNTTNIVYPREDGICCVPIVFCTNNCGSDESTCTKTMRQGAYINNLMWGSCLAPFCSGPALWLSPNPPPDVPVITGTGEEDGEGGKE